VKNKEPLTVNLVRTAHLESLDKIQARLAEFAAIWYEGSDANIWEEMVFCIFTANASARMGMRSVAAVRDLLHLEKTEAADLARVLTGIHRFPNARSGYIITTRDFLQEDCRMRLRKRLENFSDAIERRDWLVREKRIKGLGYKEASHFLRNIGLRGYAILDKHILNSLAELGVIDEAKPPANRQRYLAIEEKMRDFSHRIAIDFDELDLVLWSMKTGEILK
jgi:N-glycosylase/DNA lyase